MFSLIAGTYRTVSFFIGGTDVFPVQWVFLVVVLGYTGLNVSTWLVIACIGMTSDNVLNNVRQILAELAALDVEDIPIRYVKIKVHRH